MVEESPGWLRSGVKGGPPKHGPYADCTPAGDGKRYYVRLNEEGRRALEAYLARYPYPAAMFRTLYPRLHHALSLELAEEDINAVCLQGVVQTFLRYDPTRAKITTAVAYGIRGAATDAARRLKRRVKETSLSPFWGRTDDGPGAEPEATAEVAPDRELLLSLMDRARLRRRERLILFARARGDKLHEIASCYGLCKERIRQIECVALEKLRNAAKEGGEM